MTRRTTMVILYLPSKQMHTQTLATKTLEIIEDNSNKNLFKKQRPDVIYKKSYYLAKFIGNICVRVSFSIKLQAWDLQLYLKETLAKVFFCEFCEIFKNTLFVEHHRLTASDIRVQVVVIYNLNLFLQFVTINFTFSLLRVFTLAHALMSLNFCVDLLFGRVILSHALQDRF